MLEYELNDQFSVVNKPDIPVLSSGPDLLIGQSGSLVGVFIPSREEIRDLDLLLVRLALTRLALPRHLRCVLVGNHFPKNMDYMGLNFHEVLNYREFSLLKKFILDKSAGDSVKPVPNHIRLEALTRFEIIFRKNMELNQKDSSIIDPKKVVNEFFDERQECEEIEVPNWNYPSSKKKRKKIPIMKVPETMTLMSIPMNNNNGIKNLTQACTNAVKLNYGFDSGIPYPKHDYKLNIAVINNLPKNRFDPLKSQRVAAFSGLALVKAQNVSELKKGYTSFIESIEGSGF